MEMWAATGKTCGVVEVWHPVLRPLKDWLCLLDIKLSPPEQKSVGTTETQGSLSQPLLADRFVGEGASPFLSPTRLPQKLPLCFFSSSLSPSSSPVLPPSLPLRSPLPLTFTWKPPQRTGKQGWKEWAES